MDKLPPGKRDDWMFVAGCSMSFLMGLEALEKELIALGWKRAGWGEAETRSRMHSIISRANSASGGEWSHGTVSGATPATGSRTRRSSRFSRSHRRNRKIWRR
jgi:hypothetical protein